MAYFIKFHTHIPHNKTGEVNVSIATLLKLGLQWCFTNTFKHIIRFIILALHLISRITFHPRCLPCGPSLMFCFHGYPGMRIFDCLGVGCTLIYMTTWNTNYLPRVFRVFLLGTTCNTKAINALSWCRLTFLSLVIPNLMSRVFRLVLLLRMNLSPPCHCTSFWQMFL